MVKNVLTWLLASYLLNSYLVCTDDSEIKKPLCFCAIMNKTSTEPLMQQEFPNKMGCDETGSIACRKLCTTLAELTNQSGNGQQILCQQLMKDAIVTVSVFSKVCDDPYAPTGLEYEKPICCKNTGSVCRSNTSNSTVP